MYADLHLHSIYSDGTNTPVELCALAQQNKISVISITDHDSIDGIKALQSESIPCELKIIPGTELSIFNNRKMIHILGYYINIYDERLSSFINQMSDEVTRSNKANFEYAHSCKAFDYSWERVLELNPGQSRISGSNIIKAMKIDNYHPHNMSLRDMYFKYFLYTSAEKYISFSTLNEYDAVDVIKAIGGIPVIAHPKEIEDDGIVMKLVQHGAMGLEIFHPSHSKGDVVKYKQIAEANNLYITGGTDWHGENNRFNTSFGMYGLENSMYAFLTARS